MDVMSYVMNTSEVNPNVLRTVLNEEIEKNSGMKLDDLRFDLDVKEIPGSNSSTFYLIFTNLEQIKKVLDNDMNIVIITQTSGCGDPYCTVINYLKCNTTKKQDNRHSNVFYIPATSYGGTNPSYYSGYKLDKGAIKIQFGGDNVDVPINTETGPIFYNATNSIVAVYATI